MSTIDTWLEKLGLGKYREVFSENDIEFDVLAQLSEQDMKELGLSLGDRKRLINGIAALNSEVTPSVAVDADSSSDVLAKPQAERRQLTVMFVDLVGSTALSGQLDPEDLSIIMRRYQNTVAGEISRYEGYVAKYMGDGILAYFGWPQAHEDEAERALRTALEIVEAMPTLNADQNLLRGADLAVRIGLSTGVVVVGELIGEGASEERNVVGETPNLAARLQDLAKPNGIVIGSLTKDLAGDSFLYDDLGVHELKGITGQIKAWGVAGERDYEPDNEQRHDQMTHKMVGRQEELGLLCRAWAQSRAGTGQVVLISGEPGIGKSRLVETIGAETKAAGDARITIRCSPYHSNSALYPVIQHLQRMLGRKRGDSAEKKLAALEQALADFGQLPDNSVVLLSALLELPLPKARYPALTLSPQQQKQQIQDVLVAWMNEAAERQPSLWVWEDLHWADPSTLELLGLAIGQCPTVPILHALTFRPDFIPPWPTRSHMTPLTLNRLERIEVEALISRHTAGKALPVEVLEHIVAKTDGVPLYVEELTKMIVTADFLRDAGEHYELAGSLADIAIPATLQDSLMARLDRLPNARQVAQLGAVIGREFAYETLQAITSLEESALRTSLKRLVEAELIYQRGRPPQARYIFKHALIQDMAYQSLLKRTRQQVHREFAELLESHSPELAETEPELLAHHYTQAGLTELAVNYWQRAGQRAFERWANQEAISYLRKGLELLAALPDSAERARHELELQMALGPVLVATEGRAAESVERAYVRARALCEQLGDKRRSISVLRGLQNRCLDLGLLSQAHEFAKQLMTQTEREQDPALLVGGCHVLGQTLFYLGEFLPARTHVERGIALFDPAQHHLSDWSGGQPGESCHVFAALTLWMLGYPEQAAQHAGRGLKLVETVSNIDRMLHVHVLLIVLYLWCGNLQAVRELVRQALTESRALGWWKLFVTVFDAYMLSEQGQVAEGFTKIKQSIDRRRASGGKAWLAFFLTLQADIYVKQDDPEKGLSAISEGLAVVDAGADLWWQAELHRHKGDLLLQCPTDTDAQAEACFHQALGIARQQKAKSLELRAAMSIARLWCDQGKRQDARELLAPVYNWFTEGFDTADLKDAKALLDELA